jgi:hypothetical protein
MIPSIFLNNVGELRVISLIKVGINTSTKSQAESPTRAQTPIDKATTKHPSTGKKDSLQKN